jgi:N-methylhydantoinase A
MGYRVGVDVGGTFTDLVALEEASGRLHILKRPTTPADQSEGVADGLRALLALEGIPERAVAYLAHGTTICINAVLEKKGAATGLVTTRGMRDLLELRRQIRGDLYDLQADKPEPLVPRPRRHEVAERIRFDGTVDEPLALDEARRAIDELVQDGVRALAVFFLHSYVNPAHERAVRELVARDYPDLYLSISSEVLPEFREFERLSTTVLNAYVGPVMARYLGRLEERVRALGLPAPYILQSNGGVATASQTRERPVFTMASGPTAGVAGAVFVAQQAGEDRIITFDMGGTSTDVCLVERGTPLSATQKEYHGYPVKGAMLDVHSVGAGGGSLAWVDAGGFLRVGPESAGAMPGPACYGQGGASPTVTDANVVLGRLNPAYFLGGTIKLDPARAREAVETVLCGRLGGGLTHAAVGVLTVVNAQMAAAIRLTSVERGHDPRRFTLVAHGGAGPMHATAVARLLRIPRVLVPPSPGVLCALGLVVADVKAEWSRTWLRLTAALAGDELGRVFAELEAEAREWARRGGLPVEALRLSRSADLRYLRQNYELTLPVGTRPSPKELETKFHRLHRRVFGHASPGEPVELVTLRVAARIPVPRRELTAAARPTGGLAEARKGTRPVYFADAGGFVDCPIYERAKLPVGIVLEGPAVVEQLDCTTVIEEGQRATADRWGNLLITLPEGTGAA